MSFRMEDIPISPVSSIDEVRLVEKRDKLRVVRFDVAEPYFDPPEMALESTCTAVREGYRGYSPTKGIYELRGELSKFFKKTRGADYGAEEIIVTPGSKFASYLVFSSLVKTSDEVILLTPFWSSFKAIPLILGIRKIKESLTNPLYKIDQEAFQQQLNDKTKIVVINTPNNPTGGVLDKSDIKFLVDLAQDKGFYILSDEVDWAYTYDGHRHVSPASIGDGIERTIVVDSFSKVFCMAGWRVGFAAAPKEIIDKMNLVQQHSVTSPVTFAQKACLDVLKEYKPYIKRIVNLALNKRNFLLDALKCIKQLKYTTPPGAFYLFPEVERNGVNADNLASELLNKAHVAVTPGSLFGKGSEFNFRICYAVPDEDLREGLTRLADYFEAST